MKTLEDILDNEKEFLVWNDSVEEVEEVEEDEGECWYCKFYYTCTSSTE